jgi:preprotein translocase subunit YajC
MKTKLPADLATQDAIFYTNLTLLLLLVFLVSLVGYIIYRAFKTERKKKLFTPEMKSGDKVYFPVASGNVRGEILDVNGDDVKIVVTVPKSRVYPNE